MMKIPFNRPLVLGAEEAMISKVFETGKFSGNSDFGQQCHHQLEQLFGYKKVLLTTSCTSALEFAALLLRIEKGDEVIIPSYAFVTTANAFVNRGATVVFADSRADHPSIDETKIEQLITPKTKAIVALHYGGVACEMDTLKAICTKHGAYLIEDSAQGIGSYYKNQALGGIGTLGALSFHETKNIHCGEGGAVLVNEPSLIPRAEIVWDMGTNRKAFIKGDVNSYGWVDTGSSFYPSAFNTAFLLAQLNLIEKVTAKRLALWNTYMDAFKTLEKQGIVHCPKVPRYASHNGHTFYLLTESKQQRDKLISYLLKKGITATFHFQSLHQSPYFSDKYMGKGLPHADVFTNQLVRLPLFYGLTEMEQETVIKEVKQFYG